MKEPILLGRGYYWQDLALDQEFVTYGRTVTESDLMSFISGLSLLARRGCVPYPREMSAILVETTRGGLPEQGEHVENRHAGSVAVVDTSGRLVASAGDPESLVFTRSTINAATQSWHPRSAN